MIFLDSPYKLCKRIIFYKNTKKDNMKKRLKILFLEPFFGGSHKEFAEGLVKHSKHEIDLYTLPSRFWKWRMRGAALYFIKKIPQLKNYDVLITTDLMSLSDFKALCDMKCPPAIVYFHENQLTYPLAPGESMDFQFGFTDITTGLAADRILFNSNTHRNAFFKSLPDFLGMMPEYLPTWVIEDMKSKSAVCYPGCSFPAEDIKLSDPDSTSPLVIWNHRWEYDKNPKDFFYALEKVMDKNINFRIALLGENYQAIPKEFIKAKKRFGDRIVNYGYVESREEYIKWLKKGSIVISTATQENFGISIVEAIRFGCIPLVPARLSYPEIIPEEFHKNFIYDDQKDLVLKLSFIIQNYQDYLKQRGRLSSYMSRFSWENLIDQFDEEFETLVSV